MTGMNLVIALSLFAADGEASRSEAESAKQPVATAPDSATPPTSAPKGPGYRGATSAPKPSPGGPSGAAKQSPASKSTQDPGQNPGSVSGSKPGAKPASAPKIGGKIEGKTEGNRQGPASSPSQTSQTSPTSSQVPATTPAAAVKPVGAKANNPPAPRLASDGPAASPIKGSAQQSQGRPSHRMGDRPQTQVKDHGVVRHAVAKESPSEIFFLRGKKAPRKTSVLLLSYRHFAIRDALDRSQGWHVVGFGIAPLRRYARLTLTTEVGIEGGEAAANGDKGDVFLMQKIGAGVQYPYWVTPFIEFQAGGGVSRMEVYDRNELGILISAGLDVGAEWSVATQFKVLAAVGWIRPWRMLAKQKLAEARYFDRGTFKVGIGF